MTIQDLVKTITAKTTVSLGEQEMRVKSWYDWYQGFVQSFHEYYVYNGVKKNYMKKKTLHMAKKVCEDFADLLYNDNVKVNVHDTEKDDIVNDLLDNLNFKELVNSAIEKSFALGTGALVMVVDSNKKANLEYVYADNILPITVENGIITECGFKTITVIDNKNYAYFSVHKKVNDKYVIENILYELNEGSDTLGTIYDEWVYDTESTNRWFAIIKPNINNNFDRYSPFGISAYANCISVLKAIDNAFHALDTEVNDGKLKILVASDLMNFDLDGSQTPTFDSNDVVYQRLPKDTNENTMIETIAPSLRTNNFIEALNAQLKLLSSKVGLGSDFYTFDSNTGLKTATEVISKDSQMFRRIKKHEILLESALKPFIKAICSYHGVNLDNELLTIDFDDSIVQDKEAERTRDMLEVQAGLMNKVEFRIKWFNEDEETAKKALSQIEVVEI